MTSRTLMLFLILSSLELTFLSVQLQRSMEIGSRQRFQPHPSARLQPTIVKVSSEIATWHLPPAPQALPITMSTNGSDLLEFSFLGEPVFTSRLSKPERLLLASQPTFISLHFKRDTLCQEDNQSRSYANCGRKMALANSENAKVQEKVETCSKVDPLRIKPVEWWLSTRLYGMPWVGL